MKELRAYKIMFRFLEDRYFRLPSDSLGALLGELTLLEDGKPGDLATIKDWERTVAAIHQVDTGIHRVKQPREQ